MGYNPKYFKEVYLAILKLHKSGKLRNYILTNIVLKNWVFAAPSNKRRTLFHKRVGGTSRFAHSRKRVLYLAPSTWRTLLETSKKEKIKRIVNLFEFYKITSKNYKSPCLYLIDLKKAIRLFCLINQNQIDELNQELNRILRRRFRNIVHRSINVRSKQAYFHSQYLADAVSAIGFDGIFYKVKTPFHGNNGTIVGSPNNSMIIIFEKKDRKHSIINVPPDEEDLKCPTC